MSPVGLRLTSKARLSETTAFKLGWIEVQDEGSQIISLLSDAKPNMAVVDLCAGAGGKTLAIAAAMDLVSTKNGSLTACDISSARLDRLKPRIKRAGIRNIHTQILTTQNDEWIEKNAGTIDRVIADVPCTGTGTWRRNPISRWQLSINNLKKEIATQREILGIAAKLVKKGGRLIYATCSLLKEENEYQLSWFIKHHNNFRTIPIEIIWRQNIGGEVPTGSSLRLSPAKNGTDGFFCTILERFK
jgi:16S rRNA (cytosine967-C5)-methyltransferase